MRRKSILDSLHMKTLVWPSAANRYRYNPWRAPGSAPVVDACGMVSPAPLWQPRMPPVLPSLEACCLTYLRVCLPSSVPLCLPPSWSSRLTACLPVCVRIRFTRLYLPLAHAVSHLVPMSARLTPRMAAQQHCHSQAWPAVATRQTPVGEMRCFKLSRGPSWAILVLSCSQKGLPRPTGLLVQLWRSPGECVSTMVAGTSLHESFLAIADRLLSLLLCSSTGCILGIFCMAQVSVPSLSGF